MGTLGYGCECLLGNSLFPLGTRWEHGVHTGTNTVPGRNVPMGTGAVRLLRPSLTVTSAMRCVSLSESQTVASMFTATAELEMSLHGALCPDFV